MASTQGTPASWYPDPLGRHEHRWFDGADWTEHVSSHGRQTTDTMAKGQKVVTSANNPERLRSQVSTHDSSMAKRDAELRADLSGPVSEALLDRLLVVINQKTKIIEVNTEFVVYGPDGIPVGAVRQVGQSGFKKFMRFFGDLDQYFTHKYQVVETSGAVVLTLTRPAKFLKSRVVVGDAAGREIGQVVQKNVFGKIRFDFLVDGRPVGGIFAENWRAWNFRLEDANGTEVGRITKTFEGMLRTMFTTADNYVLQIHRPLEDPLRQLVFASALTIDVALKQDARGFSFGS